MDVDEHLDLVDTLGDMLGQKAKSKKDKFIDTMPTIIQTHLITEKDWPVTTKTVHQEAEAMAMAEAITVVVVMVSPIIEAMLITNIISIRFMMMSTRQINMVHHALYAVAIITLRNIVLKESMISMILWKR